MTKGVMVVQLIEENTDGSRDNFAKGESDEKEILVKPE